MEAPAEESAETAEEAPAQEEAVEESEPADEGTEPQDPPAESEAETPAEPAGEPEPEPEPAPEAPPEPIWPVREKVPNPDPQPGKLLGSLQYEHTTEVLADGEEVHTVETDDLFLAARQAKDAGFRILSVLSASDNAKAQDLEVLYSFVRPANTPEEFGELRLRVRIPKTDEFGTAIETVCPSLADIYPAVIWHEREMYDMYGINFDGNPDMRRMFLPDGWQGFPMRKDDNQAEQFVAMEDGEDIVLATQEEGSW